MIGKIKKQLKKLLPGFIVAKIQNTEFNATLKKVKGLQKSALAKLKTKEKIKVAFFISYKLDWSGDELYKLFESNPKFEPIIVLCPFTVYDHKSMLDEMNSAFDLFSRKNFNVVKTFNPKTNKWLDVNKELKPDIIFFSNPHKITKSEYLIHNYYHLLTCYIPYSIMLANIQQLQFNQPLHNFVWKAFYESDSHKTMAQKYARNKGENVVVAGSPKGDIFLNKNYKPIDCWKNQYTNCKRIIWAPHHTIESEGSELAYSTFLLYSQFMLDLLSKYEDKIQIVFKPHQKLKFNLYKHPQWGVEKTNDYYLKWQNSPNGQLEEGAYEDLFLTSDAMILDSISFIVEYSYTNKPALFLVRDNSIYSKFNEFGEKVFNLLYKATNKNELIRFIDETVLLGNDSLQNKRVHFIEQYLTPPNNSTSGVNIYNHIIKELSI